MSGIIHYDRSLPMAQWRHDSGVCKNVWGGTFDGATLNPIVRVRGVEQVNPWLVQPLPKSDHFVWRLGARPHGPLSAEVMTALRHGQLMEGRVVVDIPPKPAAFVERGWESDIAVANALEPYISVLGNFALATQYWDDDGSPGPSNPLTIAKLEADTTQNAPALEQLFWDAHTFALCADDTPLWMASRDVLLEFSVRAVAYATTTALQTAAWMTHFSLLHYFGQTPLTPGKLQPANPHLFQPWIAATKRLPGADRGAAWLRSSEMVLDAQWYDAMLHGTAPAVNLAEAYTNLRGWSRSSGVDAGLQRYFFEDVLISDDTSAPEKKRIYWEQRNEISVRAWLSYMHRDSEAASTRLDAKAALMALR